MSSTETPARCKNCDAALLGRYCVNCSQAADVHVPTTRELAHELLEGLTHSDSRLWRTLTTLWFKPGKLTEEFVAGRRVAYLPPFRLYLIVSIVFFLVLSLVHLNITVLKFDQATKPGGSQATSAAVPASATATDKKQFNSCDYFNLPKFKHACEVARDNNDEVLHGSIGSLSKAMFVFLPLIAFFHMLMYWRPRYRYAEQLLFFVHLHAFYFSVATLLVLIIEAGYSWPKLDGAAGVLETLLGWSFPVYTVVAMRRVFRRGWFGTLLKGVALFFVYMIVFAATIAGTIVYTAFRL
jgi:Protein of unknown function (DUF3667)